MQGTSMLGVSLRGFSMDGRGDAPLDFSGYPLALDLPNARSMRNYTLFGNTSEDAKGVGDEVVNLFSTNTAGRESSGVTLTIGADGVCVLNGTATATAFFQLAIVNSVESGTKVLLYGCPKGGGSATYLLRNTNVSISDSGNGVVATLSGNLTFLEIRIAAGYTCNNLVIRPKVIKLTDTPWSDITTADEFAHRLGYADAEHLPAFPYGSSFVAPIRVANPRAKVDLGTLNWTKWTGAENTFITYDLHSLMLLPLSDIVKGSLIVKGYETVTRANVITDVDKVIASNVNGFFYLRNSEYGALSAAEFKTAISGTYLDYELAVPEVLATYPSVLSSPLHKIGDIVDYKESNGKEWHGCGVVDLGSLSWTYESVNKRFYARLYTLKKDRNYVMFCPKYTTYPSYGTLLDKGVSGYVDAAGQYPNQNWVYIKDTDYTDTESFKASLVGVMLVYELATPTEVQGEPLPRLAIPKGESIVTLDTEVEPSNITAKV